jgi:hypothetical protein
MWPIIGAPDGSFYFDNQPNRLDQFLVNKNMAIGDAPIKADQPRHRSSRCLPWSILVSTPCCVAPGSPCAPRDHADHVGRVHDHQSPRPESLARQVPGQVECRNRGGLFCSVIADQRSAVVARDRLEPARTSSCRRLRRRLAE